MAAVVVTKSRCFLLAGAVSMVCLPLTAAVLPEDRADILYHRYSGGGVTIDGPSVLARKQFGQTVSLSGNYYVDSISSASIDVETYASPYQEERTEHSISADILEDNVIVSTGYTVSTENDYEANTTYLSISQDMLGDLTTVTLSYARGSDTITRRGDDTFKRNADRQKYSVDISQILTKNLIAGLSFDTTTDEGFLNNPYRQVRFLDSSNEEFGYGWEDEKYPDTRTSRAASIRLSYYLPYRAALQGEYRIFSDTWGVAASNVGLKYVWPLDNGMLLDFRLRHYSQTQADFYSDLYSRQNAQNYLARDKELSTYNNSTLGFGLTYDFKKSMGFIHKASVTFSYDRLSFEYDNFRDATEKVDIPGTEPLYSFSADMIQFYLSAWY